MNTATPAQDKGHRALATVAQVIRFAGVGVLATLVHVTAALGAAHIFALGAMTANLAGFCAAFLVSLSGHARYTFRVGAPSARHSRRFLALSAVSLALSSAITAVATAAGASLTQAMICMALIVPTVSFVGARYWAFSTPPRVADPIGANS
ncbi:GtrA family protein [Sulfitobacter sp. M57]|uniref:GtrA family protein n=1 Tax=unclassified Sulfitobacter TaxID=196795 RepID=UPI0023E34797|nr:MULTISPECIES: GtrA family protein [unclassified Sulfitobacter]MDF3415490.1 GtrA family protein [Sulfitobacter sp. KE5]MDF3422971.1 GtrA family protein [Sulfitobacter sp. KE43]MDF3434036.1 GtrA family protein [Sulfitobacter sp. KE42]MDF3459931.1 GtrA family protein [Sulfitobacter sp. S74]MDF3463575.1 GtrA family protein [Sulfitobacter sp. Ks18]